jgi:hypothetical protein
MVVALLLLCGLGLAGCTNTVRGLGKDFGIGPVQRYNASNDAELHGDVGGVHYESHTATEVP